MISFEAAAQPARHDRRVVPCLATTPASDGRVSLLTLPGHRARGRRLTSFKTASGDILISE